MSGTQSTMNLKSKFIGAGITKTEKHSPGRSQYLINVICNNEDGEAQTPQHEIIQMRNQSVSQQQNSDVMHSYFDKTFQLQTFGCQISKRQLAANLAKQIDDMNDPLYQNGLQNSPQRRNSIDTKKIITKTLKQQTNCFLPNYKQSTNIQKLKSNNPIYQLNGGEVQQKKKSKEKLNKIQKRLNRKNQFKNKQKQLDLAITNSVTGYQKNLLNTKNQKILEQLQLTDQNNHQVSKQNNQSQLLTSDFDNSNSNMDLKYIKISGIINENPGKFTSNDQLDYYDQISNLHNQAQNSKSVGPMNKRSTQQITNHRTVVARQQEHSSLAGWKVINYQNSSPLNKIKDQNNVLETQVKISDQPSANIRQNVQLFDQNSSKMSIDHPSPINTELAMFDDLRQLEPRNFNNLNGNNNLFINNNHLVPMTSFQKRQGNQDLLLIRDDSLQTSNEKEYNATKRIKPMSLDSRQKLIPHFKQINSNLNEHEAQVSDSSSNLLLNRKTEDLFRNSMSGVSSTGNVANLAQINEYMSRSIEVVIQRTNNSNSKLTSRKEPSPNNFYNRNIYGNSSFVITPSNQRVINSSQNKDYNQKSINQSSFIRKIDEDQYKISSDQSRMKKIILKKQQVKSGMAGGANLSNSKSSPSQRNQVKKLETILNSSDYAQFGISISQIPQKQSQTIKAGGKKKKFQVELEDLSLDYQQTIKLDKHQSEQVSGSQGDQIQHSSQLYQTSSVTAMQIIPNGAYETGTQDSQVQKGIYENRYEANDGSPFIYHSKESPNIHANKIDLTLHQVLGLDQKVNFQHLKLIDLQNQHSRHFQSHSVTPMCEPIYPNLTTDISKERLAIQAQNEGGQTAHKITNLHFKHLSSVDPQQKVQYFDQQDDEIVIQQQQDVQVSMIDIRNEEEIQDYRITSDIFPINFRANHHISNSNQIMLNQLLNKNQEEQIQRLNEMPMTLQQRIESQRQLLVSDQLYKYNPFIYSRRQDKDDSRLMQNRLKIQKERQSQSLGVVGTNIKTIGKKIQNANLAYQVQLQYQLDVALNNMNQQIIKSSNQFQPSQVQSQDLSNQYLQEGRIFQVESHSFNNSDALMGIVGSSQIMDNQPFSFMQNKNSILSGGYNQILELSSKFQHNNSLLLSQSDLESQQLIQGEQKVVETNANIQQK
eukprot:403331874